MHDFDRHILSPTFRRDQHGCLLRELDSHTPAVRIVIWWRTAGGLTVIPGTLAAWLQTAQDTDEHP